MKQKAKKAKKRVVKQKLGYKKLGYKASKAKPIAKGAEDSDGGDDDFCPVSDKSNNAKKRGGWQRGREEFPVSCFLKQNGHAPFTC